MSSPDPVESGSVPAQQPSSEQLPSARSLLDATEGLSRDDLVALVARLQRELFSLQGELGRLRGEYAELHVQLIRARQDQELYQTWIDRWRAVEAGAHRVESKLRRVAGR